ncbi:MAG: hypothetical protein IAG10_17530, partial [Planctomycetaceae bacterium]|nr:hypothetical protein [Planctomycetaceae bacterium]
MVSFSTERRNWLVLACVSALCVALVSPERALSQDKEKPAAGKLTAPVPTAIITFQDRGGKDSKLTGAKVTDLLFAELVAKPEMFLVDREELSKVLAEHEINLSGAVNPDQAIQVGQLTG